MICCPICQRALASTDNHPHAPLCSDTCRREALRRAGDTMPESVSEASSEEPTAQFQQFSATHLFCQTCQRSMPTRERLLLTLPTGDLYGYTCAHCGADVGTKTDTSHR